MSEERRRRRDEPEGRDGDIAATIEEAVTEKLERLEEVDTTPSSRYIPTPVSRAVYESDVGQCSYVDTTGRRCSETKNLEFHHVRPYGWVAIMICP